MLYTPVLVFLFDERRVSVNQSFFSVNYFVLKKSLSLYLMSVSKNIKYLLFLSVLEGALVMCFQIAGGKLLTYFFGSAIITWSIILSATMLGLGLGYLITSKQLSRLSKNTLDYILLILSFVGIYCFLFYPLAESTTRALSTFGLYSGVVFSSVLLLCTPLIALGAVPTLLISILNSETSSEKAGYNSGLVFSLSSLGAIGSTYLLGFFVLPRYGSTGVFTTFGFVVLVVTFRCLFKTKKKLLLIFCGTALLSLLMIPKKTGKTHPRERYVELFNSEGVLGKLTVVDDKQRAWRQLNVNNVSQSLMHIPSGRSQWKYVHRLAFYSSVLPAGSEVLVIGLGGGSLISELALLDFKVDVVDVDPRMRVIAEKYFNMDSPNINVSIDDGRHYIKTAEKKYDLVIFDLSAGELQPSNLYTREGFAETKNLLKEKALFFLHYPSRFQKENLTPLLSIGKTLQAAGLPSKLINTGASEGTTTEFIFSSEKGINLSSSGFSRADSFSRPYNFPVGVNLFMDMDFTPGFVMTDDKPIMDYLHMKNAFLVREATIEELKSKKK